MGIRGLLDLFVCIEAARNSYLHRLEATSILLNHGTTEPGAGEAPVFFRGAYLFLGPRQASSCLRGDSQGFSSHGAGERGEVRGSHALFVVLFLFMRLDAQLEEKEKDEQSDRDGPNNHAVGCIVPVSTALLLLRHDVVAIRICVNVEGGVYIADRWTDTGVYRVAGQWVRCVVVSSVRQGVVESVLEGRVRCQVSSKLCICTIGVCVILVGNNVEDAFFCSP